MGSVFPVLMEFVVWSWSLE